MNDDLKKFVQEELERITVKISTKTGFKGTGFFVTIDGYILTAWHCIQEVIALGSNDIFIECHGKKLIGQLKPEKSIEDLDIAVIKTKHPVNNCVPLGCVPENPSDDDIISVGYPGIHKNNAGIGSYSGKITRFVDFDIEIKDAIQGQGQSGGLIYHYPTHRIIGIVKKIYKENVLRNAGLAAKVEDLLSTWDELSDIHDEIAKAWDNRLAQFTSKTNSNGLENISEKNGNVELKVKKAKTVIGQAHTVTINNRKD